MSTENTIDPEEAQFYQKSSKNKTSFLDDRPFFETHYDIDGNEFDSFEFDPEEAHLW